MGSRGGKRRAEVGRGDILSSQVGRMAVGVQPVGARGGHDQHSCSGRTVPTRSRKGNDTATQAAPISRNHQVNSYPTRSSPQRNNSPNLTPQGCRRYATEDTTSPRLKGVEVHHFHRRDIHSPESSDRILRVVKLVEALGKLDSVGENAPELDLGR